MYCVYTVQAPYTHQIFLSVHFIICQWVIQFKTRFTSPFEDPQHIGIQQHHNNVSMFHHIMYADLRSIGSASFMRH